MFLYIGLDYDESSITQVTLTPADDSVEFPLAIIDDTLVEANELFQIVLSIPDNPPFGLSASLTASTTTITIIDDEGTKSVSMYAHNCVKTAWLH